MILKLDQLPYQTLIFFELIKIHPILTSQQVQHFIEQSPEILFDYLKKIPLVHSEEIFASIMTNVSNVSMKFPNQDYILTIYKHFLLFSLKDHSHIRFIFQSNIQWFINTLKSMKGDQLDLALLGINLLLFRFFNSYSNILLECENFNELIYENLNRIKDKIAFIDIFLYSLDPENRICPFEKLIQLENLQKIKFPPPSPSFAFRIVPIFIKALMKVSIENNNKEEEESTVFISPVLRHLMKSISPLFKNYKMVKFLTSISDSENLFQLIKYAEKDEECFRFLSLILGFSCNSKIFNLFFNSISQDLTKTLKFLSFVAESSQLVNDFLYVTREISMPLSSSSTSIAVWVRPISGISPLFQMNANKVNISMRISPTIFYPSIAQEFELPPSIDGWYFITLSFFQFNILLLPHLNVQLSPTAPTIG